jgi:regulator of protease activity HflC (stomatin/prohibitin superfamily)
MTNLVRFFIAIFILQSCARIDAGHEGILVNQFGSEKGVSQVSLVTGTVFYNPLTKDVEEFTTFVQTIDYDPFTVNAKDGSEFHVDPTISLKVIDGKSPEIYVKYRRDLDDILETTIFNYVRDAFRIQFNKYTTDSIISRREAFEAAVQAYLQTELNKEGFHLEQLTSGLQYPAIITESINAKNKAVQDAQRVENEVRKAKAQSEIKIAQSTGNAEALKIQADADAYANEKRQISLSPLLIQQQYIDKWDGHLPTYTGGGSPVPFINIK